MIVMKILGLAAVVAGVALAVYLAHEVGYVKGCMRVWSDVADALRDKGAGGAGAPIEKIEN